MSDKYVLTKLYRWMVVSKDGILETPKNTWGDDIFSFPYSSEEEAITHYRNYIDSNLSCPYTMILVKQFSKDYVV